MTRSSQRLKMLTLSAVRALLAAFSVSLVATGAWAQVAGNAGPGAPLRFRNDYFGYGLAVGPRVSYTDNIDLAPDGFKDSEVAVSLAANGSAIYSTNRFTGLIDGLLDVSYLIDQSEIVANQDIGAAGTATVVENFVYFDVAGSTRRQLAGDNARFSQNLNAARGQRVDVHNFALSPYLNHRFPDGSAAELRYRFAQVFINDDDRNNSNLFGQNFNDDSRTQEVVAAYDTGTKFDRVQIGLTAYGNRTREYGSQIAPDLEYEQGSLTADGEYALTSSFALAGTIGYDEIDTDAPGGLFPTGDLSGFFWNAGFHARPGRRTDILLKYGRRYDDDFITARIRYDLTNRITFNASAQRQFQTRAQSVTTQYEALQRRTLDFAERLRQGGTGNAADVINALTRIARARVDAQTIGIGVSNDASAGLIGAFGRTSVGVTARYHDTDFGFRQVETIGGGLNLSHRLSRRTSVYANAYYRHVDSNADPAQCIAFPQFFGIDPATVPDIAAACASLAFNASTNTAIGRVGVSHRLYSNVSAYGEYARAQRFSQNPLLEYAENSVTLGLQLEF